MAGLDETQVRERAREFLPKIVAFDGGMVEELRGIAEGAGVDFEQIVALNARTELLFGTPPQPECTVVAALPPVSDGRTIIAQNWDWLPRAGQFTIVLEVLPDDGPDMLIFVEAGMLARNGLNSAGIGVEDVQAALQDHFGYPNSVCRHVDELPGNPLPCQTVASVIADLSNRQLHISPGPPCQTAYTVYSFSRTTEETSTPLMTARR